MSAMPERCLHDFIEANENGWMCTECGVHFEPAQRAIDAESRLLAAEARVREVGQNAEQFRASMYALEERVLTLRAERDALVPLLRYFLAEFVDDGDEVPRHDCGFVRRPESGYCEFHDKWVQARAILAREAGE